MTLSQSIKKKRFGEETDEGMIAWIAVGVDEGSRSVHLGSGRKFSIGKVLWWLAFGEGTVPRRN